MSKKPKVYVAMSGGVDSSLSAKLLLDQGYEVIGAYIKCWAGLQTVDGLKFTDQCTWKGDWRDALSVAAKLKIPLVKFDFTKEYQEAVVDYFFREAAAGRTPNPDVMCNREIKFGVFFKAAMAAGADFIATGHYVKKVGNSLYKATDRNKDQSYFLWTLNNEQVSRSLFPLGDLTKPEVRELAAQYSLPVASKPDSQGLCFIGDVPMVDFIGARLQSNPGPVLTATGREVGRHAGLAFYTIGQRHGLGLPSQLPYYVAEKDKARNALIVAEGQNDEILYRDNVEIEGVSWINEPPQVGMDYGVKIRYRQPDQNVVWEEVGRQRWRGRFSKPQKAVTPGQSLVVYDGDKMLGGGIIAG